jgi:AbrB family looped-hinge helix DNA binding protein
MSHKAGTSRKRNAVVLGDRGRIVLPAEVRKELDLKPGSRIAIDTEEDGTIRLRPYAAIAKASSGMYAHLAPEGVSMVDELIAERRREAKREEERYGG